MTVSPEAVTMFTAIDVIEVPVEIAQHNQVKQSVIVEVDPGGAR